MEMMRPSGKLYKSRKGMATVLLDEDYSGDTGQRVLVLREGDYETARKAACRRLSDYDPDCGEMAESGMSWRFSWWRESIRNGGPYWVEDEVHGCPGFYFETR